MAYEATGVLSAVLPVLLAAGFVNATATYTPGPSPSTVKLPSGETVDVEAALKQLVQAAGAANSQSDALIRIAVTQGLSDEARAALASHAATLRQLLNMGVRKSRLQIDVYDKLCGEATTVATLKTLSDILAKQVYLSGDGNRVGILDAIVAGGLHETLSLLFPASLIPFDSPNAAAVRWFATVTAFPAIADVISEKGLAAGGKVRVGFQVDLRASPAHVAALADSSIAKNSGHKKAASQRENEKASKETPIAVIAVSGAGDKPAATAKQPETNKTLPASSVEDRIAMTLNKLSTLSIAPDVHRHAAANTVDELVAALGSVAGTKCKNLFIKAKKEKAPGDSRMWLVIAAHDSDTNLNALATKLGYGKIVLRFGDAESLVENLGVVQGNVTPFALMNDTALQVNVALDARLLSAGASPLFFHPLTNEASVAIGSEDLVRFINSTGHEFTVVDFSK